MRISRNSADRYRRALDAIGEQAIEEFGKALDYFRRNNPDASVAEYRDFAIVMAEQAVRKYGGTSSVIARDLFELIMESEGFPGIEAETIDPVDHERIEGAVRRHAGHLAKETPDYRAFKRGCSGLVRNESRAAANDTVAHNVEKANNKRGRAKGKVRYAVVPTKALPCAYCAMLASRGFVYRNQETAEASTHRDCTCAFLPGIEGKTTVEGYDPEHYRDVWRNRKKYEEHEAKVTPPKTKAEVFLNALRGYAADRSLGITADGPARRAAELARMEADLIRWVDRGYPSSRDHNDRQAILVFTSRGNIILGASALVHVRLDHEEEGGRPDVVISSVVDSIKNPLGTTDVTYNSFGEPSYRMIGVHVTTVVNPDTNEVITAWNTKPEDLRRFRRRR